jgi:hypothetical protein
MTKIRGKGHSVDYTGKKAHHEQSLKNFENTEVGHKPTSHTVHSGGSTPAIHAAPRTHMSKISLFKH